jgi:hypothetical protein
MHAMTGEEHPVLRSGGADWWYLTMSLARLGEVGEATALYEKLLEELTRWKPGYPHLQLREEAAEVLGIETK